MLLHKGDPSSASRPAANVHYVHQVHLIGTTSSAAIGGLTSISSVSIVTRNARRVSEVWKVLPAQEWLAAANEHEYRSYEAETHRLKGELLVKQDDSNAAEAQSSFQRAIEIAQLEELNG
jgi:hypothetical protein